MKVQAFYPPVKSLNFLMKIINISLLISQFPLEDRNSAFIPIILEFFTKRIDKGSHELILRVPMVPILIFAITTG